MQHELTIDSGKAASNPELVAKLVLRAENVAEDFADSYRSNKLAHELFQEVANDTPRRTAIVCDGRQLTYAELNERANQLARHLQKLGAGTEVLVAICLERSLDVAVSILATLKAGAAYLPLDPAYPSERLAFMVADAKPRIVITHEHLRNILPRHDARVVVLDSDWPTISQCSATNLPTNGAAENLAYVIYTSGSTGRPKGVMITHGNVGHYVQSVRGPVGLNSADSYLHTASISFSSSVRQLMLPLSLGAKVVIASTDQIRDQLALFELIKQQAVTVIDVVPSYWRSCIQSLAGLEPAERESLLSNNLRLILSASEPLPSDVPRDWMFGFRHRARLMNMFGQTETAGIVATYPIPRVYEDSVRVMPIGRPIPHTQIHLLDSNSQPVAEGFPGEVHIGGPGIGRGYLNHPELTAEKFVPDPFSAVPGARLYKTGDLGRVGSDGSIQFLGRMDNQVKIRGHRVEPGEIEALLRQLTPVEDALVIARREDGTEPRLVAYVVPRRSNSSAISGRARYALPNNMAIVQQNKHETDFFYQQIFVDQSNFRHGITLRDGDCVFDVGANIGMFALFAQQVRRNISLFAFEPIPPIFEALAINTSLYCDNAKLFQCGLAEKSGDAEFTFYPDSSSQSGRYADTQDEREVLRSIIANTSANGSNGDDASGYLDQVVQDRVRGTKVTCQLKTLSEIIREHSIDRIDLLKIDVEKSELDVLAGIEDCDWPRIRQIVIEAHDVNGNLSRLTMRLKARGYSVTVEQDEYLKGSNLYNVFAIRWDSLSDSTNEPVTKPFVVPVLPDSILDPAVLREHVQEKLPDYLWPSAFVVMDSLPRLPNGKVDRQALPAPARERDESDAGFITARTPTEESLSTIWAEVLKLDRISVHDNFFDLGGDSILSAQIIARARKAGLRLTPKHLFKYQTIAELALVLEDGPDAPRDKDQQPEAEAAPPESHTNNSAIAKLSSSERSRLLLDFNQTAADYPRDKCVHELFEAQVARTPDAVALKHEAETISFSELNCRANQVAHRLRALGVGPESLVGVYLERSVEMVVALLGVLKAGGAYVPLDAVYPQELIQFMIEDAQLSILLTQQNLLARVERTGLQSICLDGSRNRFARESSDNPAVEVTSDNLAYVIYTSGSTGKPKGVMIPHRGLVNYLSWAIREYEVAAGCGAPVHTSIAFDLTITSLFNPLLVGQTVHLLPEERGVDALGHCLADERNFSLVKITPTHLQTLSATLLPAEAPGRTRALVIGGEALTMQNLSYWRQHAPATRLINEYGPTETVVGCCVYEVGPDDPSSGGTPIGRPIANTRLYVLDEMLEPVAIGAPGELYVGGDGVARGYLNRPELTAERFIPDPFSEEPGARLYKTGDLVRYRDDGNIEFLGRLDDQVKIRGYRIELGEIESALIQHQNVRDCVAVAREDMPGDRRLVAYVVPTSDEPLRINKLRDFLKDKLPDYMIPSCFVMVNALPVTLNGKVDRKTLPPPDRERPDLESGFTEARTSKEKVLVQIWADVLKLERVGVNDNFFDLGGDSILGTQILARATKAGLRMTPKQLFQYQTIAGLSRAIEPGGPVVDPKEMKLNQPGTAPEVRQVSVSPQKAGLSREDIDKVLAQIKDGGGGRPHVN
ncbi:MAG: amino acid adenylation domain-containing protein [Pyrinomonadaceae bacterium]